MRQRTFSFCAKSGICVVGTSQFERATFPGSVTTRGRWLQLQPASASFPALMTDDDAACLPLFSDLSTRSWRPGLLFALSTWPSTWHPVMLKNVY